MLRYYTFDEIENDIRNYFRKDEDVADSVVSDSKEILQLDIDEAVERLKNIRGVYKKTQVLPIWFRKLVFEVLYQYFYSDVKEKKTQLGLLEKIGLSKDIFTKHWNMYSPSGFAETNKQYYPVRNLPLNHAEVEGNDVYRAMIHYMLFYADVPTDTFIDVFGKMGIVPALCASGYNHRKVLVENDKVIKALKQALQKPLKVYSKIEDIVYEIDVEKKKVVELREKYSSEVSLAIECTNISQNMDLYEFVAKYLFISCIMPEYWLDTTHLVGVSNKPEQENIDMKKVSSINIRNFKEWSKEEFVLFAKEFQKIEIEQKKGIEYAHKMLKELYFEHQDLLYVDPPKYIREFEKFSFSRISYRRTAEMLSDYRGNWIFVWKNYVQKYNQEENMYNNLYTNRLGELDKLDRLHRTPDGLENDDEKVVRELQEERREERERKKAEREEERKKEGRILTEKEKKQMEIEEQNHLIAQEMREILDYFKLLDERKKLYVFRYRDRSIKSNSIVFITNIPIKQISLQKFSDEYGFPVSSTSKLIIEDFSDFRKKSANYL